MGLSATPEARRVYVDTNIIVYLVEGYAAFAPAIQRFREAVRDKTVQAFTSELTLTEALVMPFKQQNAAAIHAYRRFIEDSGAFTLIPTTRDIYVKSAFTRASLGLKSADAIHVASAQAANCELFLSNDRDIRTPQDMFTVRLEDLSA